MSDKPEKCSHNHWKCVGDHGVVCADCGHIIDDGREPLVILKERITELERDAARLEWLVNQAHREHDYYVTKDHARWFIGFYVDESIQDFRAAIDAAMGKP